MTPFDLDSETVSILIRAGLLGLVGMVYWFVRMLYKDFKEIQRQSITAHLNHDKVQTQLISLQLSQAELQKDINIILETLLRKETSKNTRR